MRTRRFVAVLLAAACGVTAGCRSKPPVIVAPPAPLDVDQIAALRWLDTHAVPLSLTDSARDGGDRTAIVSFVGNASVFGISELTEGTREFPQIVQQLLHTLADASGFRGIAVQANMADAMDIDRYVRTGVGSPTRLLRQLGSHWDTQEVLALVESLHAYNRSHGASAQIRFYGFELPTASRAVQIATSLPDSVGGRALNAWLRRELACVALGESAAWGRGSYAADSIFWTRCRDVAGAAVDSLHALRSRVTSSQSSSVEFAEQMARLIQHHVSVGLRHLSRHETVAEHILWLANNLGTDGKLLVWGRDVESGRLSLGPVVQSAVPLSQRLGDRYRNLAFTVGEGTIRARPIVQGREPGSERTLQIRAPTPASYENVLNRARLDLFLADLRSLATDTTAAWLKGPHPARLISGVYTGEAPGAFETALEFPVNFDGVLFVRRVNASTPIKH